MCKFRNTVYVSICRIAIDDEYTKFYDQVIGIYTELSKAKKGNTIIQLVEMDKPLEPIIEYQKIDDKWIEKKMHKWYRITGEPLPF